jgi:glutathione S-transferase
MEAHLKRHRYFAADRLSVADIALYAYTHLAHECDFDLAPYPAIRAWLERVGSEQDHVPMDWRPENVVAAE